MKKVIFLWVLLFVPFLFAQGNSGQESNIVLTVFEPISSADFAAFAMADVPRGDTRIFAVRITPIGKRIKMKGIFKWQDERGSDFVEVLTFTTNVFTGRPITNLDIGRNDIKTRSNKNSEVVEEIFKRGKPTGTYEITLQIFDPNQSFSDAPLASNTKRITFTNPSQTITIDSPEANSTQDVGSAVLQWNNIIGATSYEILANIRRNENQSLEEAISLGTPIIDHVDVGSRTVVNLRELFTREPLPGQEVVVQVIAVIPGPAGGEKLNSDIVNFYIDSSDSPEEVARRSRMVSVMASILTSQGGDFLELLRDGDIDLSSLRIIDESGKVISYEELEQVLNYLQSNPDALISVEFYER